MDIINGGVCSNGVGFEDLSLDLFESCDDSVTDESTSEVSDTTTTDGATDDISSHSTDIVTSITNGPTSNPNYACRPTINFYFILIIVSLSYLVSI